jgi:hypothetical protein
VLGATQTGHNQGIETMATIGKQTGATAPKKATPAVSKAPTGKPSAAAKTVAKATPVAVASTALVAKLPPAPAKEKQPKGAEGKPAPSSKTPVATNPKSATGRVSSSGVKKAGLLTLATMMGTGATALMVNALTTQPASANNTTASDPKKAQAAKATKAEEKAKPAVSAKPVFTPLADGSLAAKVTLANGQQVSTTFTHTGEVHSQANADNSAVTFVDVIGVDKEGNPIIGKEVTVGLTDNKTVTSWVIPTADNQNPNVTVSQFERLTQADGSVKQGKSATQTLSANDLANANPKLIQAKAELAQQVGQMEADLNSNKLSDASKASIGANLQQSKATLEAIDKAPAMALTNGEGGLSRLAVANVSAPTQATPVDPAKPAEKKKDKLNPNERAFFEGARALTVGVATIAGGIIGGLIGGAGGTVALPIVGTVSAGVAGTVAGGAAVGGFVNGAFGVADNFFFKADDGLSKGEKFLWTGVDTLTGAAGGLAGPLVGRAGSLVPAVVKNSKPIAFGASVLAKSPAIVQAGARQAVPGGVIGSGSQLFSNVRNDRPLLENVGQSGLFGAGTGFLTGGMGYKLQSAEAARLASARPTTVPTTTVTSQTPALKPITGTNEASLFTTTGPSNTFNPSSPSAPSAIPSFLPNTNAGGNTFTGTPVPPPTTLMPPVQQLGAFNTSSPLPAVASKASVLKTGGSPIKMLWNWSKAHPKTSFALSTAATTILPMTLGGNKPSTATPKGQADGQTPITEAETAEVQPVYTYAPGQGTTVESVEAPAEALAAEDVAPPETQTEAPADVEPVGSDGADNNAQQALEAEPPEENLG